MIAAAVEVLPDPGLRAGSFRVLPYAAGGYVIVDERLPAGRRTVERVANLATAYMRLYAIAGVES